MRCEDGTMIRTRLFRRRHFPIRAGPVVDNLPTFVAGPTACGLHTFMVLELVQDLGWPVRWFPVLVFALVVAAHG